MAGPCEDLTSYCWALTIEQSGLLLFRLLKSTQKTQEALALNAHIACAEQRKKTSSTDSPSVANKKTLRSYTPVSLHLSG